MNLPIYSIEITAPFKKNTTVLRVEKRKAILITAR
jgi:hypothetical protein